MRYRITAPQHIRSQIKLPASKSISGRALIINALAKSTLPLENVSDCDDTHAMLTALKTEENTVNIGAAGTAMRFLTAYFSLQPGSRVLTGSDRMQHRPIGILVDALHTLGADIAYEKEEGYPPLCITGTTLKGGLLTLPGNVSSQYISALLMIAPLLDEGLQLRLSGEIVSVPYINMTLQIMADFGADARWVDDRTLQVLPGKYKARPFRIENDWSAASYWYEQTALVPSLDALVHLSGLNADSTQGDAQVSRFFELLGVKTTFEEDGITLGKGSPSTDTLHLDLKNQPDLAQTLVCTCLASGRPFRFEGLANLKIKETDRLAALRTEARKLGFVVKEWENSILSWDGERTTPEQHPVIATYEDHRMAMSFAPMALTGLDIIIENPQVVSKSYPDYWTDLRKAGFTISKES